MPAGEIPTKKKLLSSKLKEAVRKRSVSQKQHAQQRTLLVKLQLKSDNQVGIDAFYSVYL